MSPRQRWRRHPLIVLLPLLVAGLTAAHAHAVRQGPEYTGVLLVLSHQFTILSAMALLLLCAALGTRILARAGIPLDPPLEALPFATATGVAAAGTAFLVAGAVGGLRPWGVALVLVALLMVSGPALRPTLAALIELPADLRRALPGRELRAFVILGTFAVAAVILPVALAPPADWDGLMYHLDIPAEFLRTGRIHVPDDNLHVALIGPVQLLYIPLLALGAPSGPAVLSALLALLLVPSLLACGARYLSPCAAALGSVAVWGNAAVLLVAATSRVDVTIALYAFLGHFALLLAWGQLGRRSYLLAAAILGAAVGVKVHALLYIAALSPLVVWLAWSRPWEKLRADEGPPSTSAAEGARGGRAPFLLTLLAFAGVGILAALPWLLKNHILLGTPFYPPIAPLQLPPWLAGIFGTREMPESLDPYVLQVLGRVREPFNLLDAFLAPGKLTVEAEGAFYFLSPILVLLPMALLGLRHRTSTWLLLGGAAYLLFLLVPFGRTNLRYLIPGLVPLTLVAVHGLLEGIGKVFPSRETRLRLAGLTVILSLVPATWAAVHRPGQALAVQHLLGRLSAADYLAQQGNVLELRRLVAGTVPSDGRVLFLFEARGFGLERKVIQDNYVTNWGLLVESGASRRCLAGTGISHIMIARGAVEYYLARGMDPRKMRLPALQDFSERCLEPVASSSSFDLYRVIAEGGVGERPAAGPVIPRQRP